MIIAILLVLGLCFGSFVNALVWRLHEQEEAKEQLEELTKKKQTKASKNAASKLQARLKDLSISTGRSMCVDCSHTLTWYDLVPVLSWLSVGGKCRYCRKPISWQYPLIELATAAIFMFSYMFWPQELTGAGLFNFVIWLITLVAFMAMTIYDFRWMIIPNVIVYPLILLTALQRVVDYAVFGSSWLTFLLTVAAALIGGGFFYILYQVSAGNWIGGGDVKLGFALGFLVGTPIQALLLLLIASLLGLVGSIPALVQSKSKHKLQIPFGPFLMLACVILVLFGTSVVRWYSNLLIPS